MKEHCFFADQLLQHYQATWKDREIYWAARDYARHHRGTMLVLILDSYDKAKVTLPRWPYGRVPKKPFYEKTRRLLSALSCFSDTTLYPFPTVSSSVAPWPKEPR